MECDTIRMIIDRLIDLPLEGIEFVHWVLCKPPRRCSSTSIHSYVDKYALVLRHASHLISSHLIILRGFLREIPRPPSSRKRWQGSYGETSSEGGSLGIVIVAGFGKPLLNQTGSSPILAFALVKRSITLTGLFHLNHGGID